MALLGGSIFADFQASVVTGVEHDGADLVSRERLTDGGPGGVSVSVEESLFDRSEDVKSEDTKEDVGIDTMPEVMVDGAFGEGALHRSESTLCPSEQHVGSPGLISCQVVAVSLE